jgi:hypothetical protein
MLFNNMNRQRQGLANLNQPNQMAYDNANPNARFLNQQMPKQAQNQNMYSPFNSYDNRMAGLDEALQKRNVFNQYEGRALPTPVGVQQQSPYNRAQQPQRNLMNRRQQMMQRMRDPRFRERFRRMMMMRNRRPMDLNRLGRRF